jgi:endonuclease/exonuclease/phosphatase family metal-dependent hydrolase
MIIKIISLNLWIGGVFLDKIIDFLRQENADIVLLQEVFDGRDETLKPQYRTLQELEKALTYPHAQFAPAFLEDVDGKKIVQGNAVLSQFPLKEVSTVFYDVPFGERIDERWAFSETPRNLQHVAAEVNGRQLHLFNTQGIWGEDGRDTPRRLAMATTIMREVAASKPVVLAGDFNVEPDTETMQAVRNSLKDVFYSELTTTFNTAEKDLIKYPGYATSVVDMMFVSDDISVVKHHCPEVGISDHLPLVAEIELA